MPIENERKFVLRIDSPEMTFSEVADSKEYIEQIYLMFGKKQSARIRKARHFYCDKEPEWKYTFTFKQDVGKKTVEVETPLEFKDYDLLSRKSVLIFNKWRYHLGDWEVDFFKNMDKTYFVQAEIELPEGVKRPVNIHPLIGENMIHLVKRWDGRFSSKKLGDPRYAQRLMQNLMESRV